MATMTPFTIAQQIAALQDKLTAYADRAQEIKDRARDEERELTPGEDEEFESIVSDSGVLNSIREEISRLKNVERRDNAMHAILSTNPAQVEIPKMNAHIQPQPQNAEPMLINSMPNVVTPTLRAFGDAREAYKSGMWLRMLINKALDVDDPEAREFCDKHGLRAQHTVGDPTTGGYTVPVEVSRTLLQVLEDVGIARQISRIIPMSTMQTNVPKKTDGVTIYYTNEAAAINTSEQTFTEVPLKAEKRSALSKVSQELQDDSVIPFVDDLVMRMGHDLANKTDEEFILGDGTPAYAGANGLLPNLGTAGVVDASGNDWDSITAADITHLMSHLPDRYKSHPLGFVCSHAFYHGVLLRILSEAGGNTITTLEVGSNRQAYLTYPVYLTHWMPTTSAGSQVSLLFGAWQEAVLFGNRLDVRVAISQDRYFEEDVLAARITHRYDIQTHEGGDASNPGAYVGLSTTT